MVVFSTYDKILGIYSLALIIIGTVGNLTGISICLQPSLRKLPTFVFMAFILFMDIMPLYIANLDVVLGVFKGIAFENINIYFCRANAILSYISQQGSALLTVSSIM